MNQSILGKGTQEFLKAMECEMRNRIITKALNQADRERATEGECREGLYCSHPQEVTQRLEIATGSKL